MVYSPSTSPPRVRPNPTSWPIVVCSSSATCSMTCAAYVPRSRRVMNPPRSPMLQRCSSRPGIADTSASVNPRTSADEMCSYSPTRMSSRVTGWRDQKFAPRVACSDIMRSSVDASGGVIRSGGPVAGKQVQLREHRGYLVGENEHEVVVLHLAHRMRETFCLLVDDLYPTVVHPCFVQSLDDQ